MVPFPLGTHGWTNLVYVNDDDAYKMNIGVSRRMSIDTKCETYENRERGSLTPCT